MAKSKNWDCEKKLDPAFPGLLERIRLARSRAEGREVDPDEIRYEMAREYFRVHPHKERQILSFVRRCDRLKEAELSPEARACYQEFRKYFERRGQLKPSRHAHAGKPR